MSDLASIAEESLGVGQKRGSNCPICGFEAVNIQKLKTHLLLKHKELHLCLFCVEKKGWSDTFASQASYNQHYWELHQGAIQQRQQSRNEDKNRRLEWRKNERQRQTEAALLRGKPPPKRLKKRLICTMCKPNPLYFEMHEKYERHLIAEHRFEYCKVCLLMGPSEKVRLHIVEKHSGMKPSEENKLACCYICCGSGPSFDQVHKLKKHWANKHGLKLRSSESDEDVILEYPCFNCGQQDGKSASFPSLTGLRDHLKYKHDTTRSMGLKSMSKRRPSNQSLPPPTASLVDPIPSKADESLQWLTPPRRVTGIRNASGQDCFCVAALHLLAQTDLVSSENLSSHSNECTCTKASCLLAHFYNKKYFNSNKRERGSSSKKVNPECIIQNYKSFGLETTPTTVDSGEFLRACLYELCSPKLVEKGQNYCEVKEDPDCPVKKDQQVEKHLKSMMHLSLEWKFECPGCKRYMYMSMQDYVLKLSGSIAGSLEELLDSFLHLKKCKCGTTCKVYPGVKSAGEYIFLEIDRTVANNDENEDLDSKELSLFSLKLRPHYNLFGFKYAVLGTINYLLDSEEGGHYLTYLFCPSGAEIMRIHEGECKSVRRRPDFDSDTFVVALKKVDMTAEDVNVSVDMGNKIDSGQLQHTTTPTSGEQNGDKEQEQEEQVITTMQLPVVEAVIDQVLTTGQDGQHTVVTVALTGVEGFGECPM